MDDAKGYTVRLEAFEGPLHVLLEMIEARKLDITEVSLASVADEFVSYVERSGEVPMELLADFLTVASKLLLIKSRAILPVLELEEDEEEESDLEEQLREYRRFKEASERLRGALESSGALFSREAYAGINREAFAPVRPSYQFDPNRLASVFRSILRAMPDPEALRKKVVRRIVSVEEKMERIRRMVRLRKKQTFSACVDGTKDRDDVAVAFLAVLELSRTGAIRARQSAHFEDIFLEYRDL